MEHRVVVPRLLSRQPSMWLVLVGTVVALVGLTTWYAIKPETRVAALVFGGVSFAFFGLLVSRRVVIDTGAGTVTSETAGLWRRTSTWDRAEIVTTPLRQTLLSVGPAKIPLAADDLGGPRRQRDEVLELLATEVERWAPDKVAVGRVLRSLTEG